MRPLGQFHSLILKKKFNMLIEDYSLGYVLLTKLNFYSYATHSRQVITNNSLYTTKKMILLNAFSKFFRVTESKNWYFLTTYLIICIVWDGVYLLLCFLYIHAKNMSYLKDFISFLVYCILKNKLELLINHIVIWKINNRS